MKICKFCYGFMDSIMFHFNRLGWVEIKAEEKSSSTELYISNLYGIILRLCLAVLGLASLQVEVSTFQYDQDLSMHDYVYTSEKCSSSFILVILAEAVILLPSKKETYLLILSHSHNSAKHWLKQNAVFWTSAVSS